MGHKYAWISEKLFNEIMALQGYMTILVLNFLNKNNKFQWQLYNEACMIYNVPGSGIEKYYM